MLGGVEVDVVGHLERQPELNRRQGVDCAVRVEPAATSSVIRVRAADQRAGPVAMNGLSDGAANTSSASSVARSRTLSATRTPTRGGPAGPRTPVGQVVQAERRTVGYFDDAHPPECSYSRASTGSAGCRVTISARVLRPSHQNSTPTAMKTRTGINSVNR